MGITFFLAALLVTVLGLGCLASVLAPKPLTEPPSSHHTPPLAVGACTIPVAAFVFYLALGYPMLAEILPVGMVQGIFVGLQLVAPLAAAGVCTWYYFKYDRRLRYFLMLWINLVLMAVGAGVWNMGAM